MNEQNIEPENGAAGFPLVGMILVRFVMVLVNGQRNVGKSLS